MQKLEQENIACRTLHTSHAFHSAMVEPVVERLRSLLDFHRQLNETEIADHLDGDGECIDGCRSRFRQSTGRGIAG